MREKELEMERERALEEQR
jgi:hypothetical protein